MISTKQSKREALDREALERGSRCQPNSNDAQVYLQFGARGIAPHDIETCGPHQNVRTYRAWRALGRQVRKGEKSVRLTVWITDGEDKVDAVTGKVVKARTFPRPACVFHVSQTDPSNGKDGAR